MSSENGEDLKYNNIQSNNFDLCGKVIIKAQLRDDIRRVPIHNEEITYDELVLMMQRVFRGQLNPDDDIVIKYKDEDGDMVTIFDSADLAFAIQYSRILKLKIYMKGKDGVVDAYKTQESLGLDSLENVGDLRRELRAIRDRVNKVLDVLLDNSNEDPKSKSDQNLNSSTVEVSSKTDIKSEPQDVQVVPHATSESAFDKIVYPNYDSRMVPDGPMVSSKPSLDGFGSASETNISHFSSAPISTSQANTGLSSSFPIVSQPVDDKVSTSFMAQAPNGNGEFGGYPNYQQPQTAGQKSTVGIGGPMPSLPSSSVSSAVSYAPPSTYGTTQQGGNMPSGYAPPTSYNPSYQQQPQAGQAQMSYQYNSGPPTSAYAPRPLGTPQQGYMSTAPQGYMPPASNAPGAPPSPSMQRMTQGSYMGGPPPLQGPPLPGQPSAVGGNNPYSLTRNPPPAAWK